MEHLDIVLILTMGFALASLFAYIAQRLKLSPILGYLFAGFIIGPYSPGYVADSNIAEQLAEIGVILMLFGVGMHFKIEDLMNVKYIAIPGAVFQTVVATIVTMAIVYFAGGSMETGLILGLSIGVASTVVLVRMLTDHHLLSSLEGHIAIGWLIVEDIFTVIILIMLPTLALFGQGNEVSWINILQSLTWAGTKFLFLVFFMFTWGQKIVAFILTKVAGMRSQELFTVVVLALVLVIATGATVLFGISIALGAFIAGMVIGKTDVRHQAAANAFPLKDIFGVLFFVSVGMIFNPEAIVRNFGLFFCLLMVVLLVKPLSAYLISSFMGYPIRTSLVIAIGLAQIGEFSFILAEQALKFGLFTDDGYDYLVACAIVSICLNPFLFEKREYLISLIKKLPFSRERSDFSQYSPLGVPEFSKVILVGCGHIGKAVLKMLKGQGIDTVAIENDIDIISQNKEGENILYGNATDINILKSIHIENATHMLITISDGEELLKIIERVRQLNPLIDIVAYVQSIAEGAALEEMNVRYICTEREAIKEFVNLTQQLFPSIRKRETKR